MKRRSSVERRPSRNLLRDVRWGVLQALVLTAICFIPATLAYVGQGTPDKAGRISSSFGEVSLLYGTMAVAGGAVLGLFRPALRRRGGALGVGALVGAVTFTILLWTAGPESDRFAVRSIGAFIGALVGSMLGVYMQRRVRSQQ